MRTSSGKKTFTYNKYCANAGVKIIIINYNEWAFIFRLFKKKKKYAYPKLIAHLIKYTLNHWNWLC